MSRQALLLGFFLTIATSIPLQAAEKSPPGQTPPRTPLAWTYDEAMGQLVLNPDDVYLQYVVLQLARQQNTVKEAADQIEQLTRRAWRAQGRRADLFDLFSGAAAVQECLQVDAMQGRQAEWLMAANDASRNTVKLTDLKGPTIKSHPWDKMLAAQTTSGKKPEISPLALCVPDDQLYVQFRTLTKLLEISEAGDLWGDHFASQAAHVAQTQNVGEKVKRQLAIVTDPLTRPFYDTVVREVAMTASDLYFREGTDITMLFALKQPAIFRLRMDGYLETAAASRSDAVKSSGKIHGVEYAAVVTPDREISAYSAYPRADLHIRSNSKAALQRVLATIDGKQGIEALGTTTEMKYIRTLMASGDPREDGFVYLSDPFIRRVVGPQLKLTERRRLVCYNHLRMIGHAAAMYRTQFGKVPRALEQLVATDCAPATFMATAAEPDALACPCGGKYSLSADGTTGVCSHHGHARQMTPCLEIPLEQVTEAEAKEYRTFLEQYSRYWQRFFDPIAIRLQVSPKQYRAETIILPLIDNSVYSGMAMALGGEPEPLDAMPIPKRNIFSMVLRLNKEQLMKHEIGRGFLGINGSEIPGKLAPARVQEFLTKGIGNQIGLHIYDASPFFDFNLSGFLGQTAGWFSGSSGRIGNDMFGVSFLIASLNAPVYIAIPVKDAAVVDKFLDELDVYLAAVARQAGRGGFFSMNFDFYKVGFRGTDPRIRCYGVGLENVLKWRLFVGRIDDGLYIASKPFILEDLAAMKQEKSPAAAGPTAHAMARVRAENWKDVLPDYRLGWEENARQACLNNLSPLSSASRALAAGNRTAMKADAIRREADRLHAVHFFCPDGGNYEVSPDGKQVTCTVHGSAAAPRQLAAPVPTSPTGRVIQDLRGATAELTFLEDGLHAVMTIERK